MNGKLLLAFLFAAASASGAVVRVVSTAADKTGAWESSYLNINEAVTAAGVDGTIIFKNGTYNLTESITLTADNQTLKGETRMGVVLNGQNLVRIVNAGTFKTPNFKSLTFRNGRATAGGAIYLNAAGTTPVFDDCDFFDNTATDGRGGAIYCNEPGNGTYTSCRFFNNKVDAPQTQRSGLGGAVSHYNNARRDSTRSTYTDCVFSNNSVCAGYTEGGAVETPGHATFTRCTLIDNKATTLNSAPYGGVLRVGKDMVIDSCTISGPNMAGSSGYGSFTICSGTTVITNCTFRNIVGANANGFILDQGGHNVTVTHCSFVGITNSAHLVMLMYSGTKAVIRNCLFAENSGGGLLRSFEIRNDIPRIENCTIVNNASSFTVLDHYMSGTFDGCITNVLVNTLLAGSTIKASLWNSNKYELFTTNCLVGMLPNQATNNCELILSPDPVCRSAARGDYVPRPGSAALGRSLILAWMANSTDLAGKPRLVDGVADIGAFQRQADETDPDYSLRAVASEADRVGIWANAKVGIQPAIDAALNDDTIYVKEGYYPLERAIRVVDRGVYVIGAGIGRTIVDAQGQDRCLYAELTDNARGSSAFSGFTFQNGSGGDSTADNKYGSGGAVYLANSLSSLRLRMTDCRITSSHAPYYSTKNLNTAGGGLYAKSYCTITRCLIDNNTCSNCYAAGVYADGAGAGNRDSTLLFTDCIISNNNLYGQNASSGVMGEGAYLKNGSWWEGCTFACNGRKNPTAYYGGAIAISANYQVITNCNFFGNMGSYGICSGWKVTHCRLWDNSATGQISAHNTIENCWLGNPSSGSIVFCQGTAFSPFRNCVFTGSTSGTPFNLFSTGNTVTGLVENCTFVGNGLIFSQRAEASTYKIHARNCIFWDNTRIMGVGTATADPAITFENCLVSEYPTCSYAAENTIVGKNPLFEDIANGNFQLKSKSPARDMAAISDWMKTGVDFVDGPRIMNKYGKTYAKDPSALPDIGAYECTNRVTGLKILWR